MSTATRATRPPGLSSSQPAKRLSLSDVTSKGRGLPSRYVLHGPEGSGKTSFGAHFPKPIFIQTKGETGIETLIDSGRLPEVAHFPECMSYADLLAVVSELTDGEHDYKTLVIDTLNGAERLCHEFVCDRDFGSKWGKDGFTSYMTGFEVSLADWRTLLGGLDRLREERKMTVVCLCHTKVAPFKNPEGPDYDRYQPDMHPKTWGLTHKWADAVLFLNFETFTEKDGQRSKGKGGQQRIMFAERHAAYDAKNRHGLPPEIILGETPAEAFEAFKQAIVTGRNKE